jgi:hypothetical protein
VEAEHLSLGRQGDELLDGMEPGAFDDAAAAAQVGFGRIIALPAVHPQVLYHH